MSQRILVIDDSKIIRMRVKDMLPSDNVQILEARDGQEGLDLIHSKLPQLIILDFLLPKKKWLGGLSRASKKSETKKYSPCVDVRTQGGSNGKNF